MTNSSTPSFCSIDDCEALALSRGWCSKHYSRFKAHGDPMVTKKPRYGDIQCAVTDCTEPRRKREWCAMHYSRWRKNGSVADDDQAWVWSEFDACLVCSDSVPTGGEFRRYCSRSCAVMASRGVRELTRECAQCKTPINLNARSESGRKKYSNAAVCAKCRAPHLQPHVPALFIRDGNSCGVCREEIDPILKYPDMRSASVDHVMPRSRGGADHLDNYQLAHFLCNIRKQDKVGFTLAE